MKKATLIGSVAVGVLGLVVSANAVERHLAARETADALKIIDSGMDWDGVTPISTQEQAERMEANVDVWQSQKNQRNTRGLLGLLLIGGGAATAVFGPKLGRCS